jgi:hypothetical protein
MIMLVMGGVPGQLATWYTAIWLRRKYGELDSLAYPLSGLPERLGEVRDKLAFANIYLLGVLGGLLASVNFALLAWAWSNRGPRTEALEWWHIATSALGASMSAAALWFHKYRSATQDLHRRYGPQDKEGAL